MIFGGDDTHEVWRKALGSTYARLLEGLAVVSCPDGVVDPGGGNFMPVFADVVRPA